MGKLTSTTKGVCELENYHHGLEGTRPPMFNTWPTAHFCELFFCISSAGGNGSGSGLLGSLLLALGATRSECCF